MKLLGCLHVDGEVCHSRQSALLEDEHSVCIDIHRMVVLGFVDAQCPKTSELRNSIDVSFVISFDLWYSSDLMQ